MKIILHIGTPKTGSTSIQATCHSNTGLLRKKGILYPKVLDTNRHSVLTIPFLPDGPPREFWNSLGRDKESCSNIALKLWKDVAADFYRSEQTDTLLLSSEYFSRIVDLKPLEALLRELFPNVQLVSICYLRNPVDHYISSLQQKLKASHKVQWPSRREWSSNLKQWAGITDLSLREFNRSELFHGDVAADFLHAIGIEEHELEEFTLKYSNESISAEGIFVLQQFRQHMFAGANNVFKPESNELLTLIRRASKKIPEKLRPQKAALTDEARSRAIAASWFDAQALLSEFGFRFRDESIYDEAYRPAKEHVSELQKQTRNLPLERVLLLDNDRAMALYSQIIFQLLKRMSNTEQGGHTPSDS